MVKLKGPSVSAEASGSLADVLTFSHSNKAGYAKTHAAPSNPRSGPQMSTRAAAKFLAQQWKDLSSTEQLTWQDRAENYNLAPYHAFLKYNMLRWRTFRTPTKEDPATETSTIPKAPFTTGVGGIKMATLQIILQIPPPTWGYCLMRSTASIGASQWDLVVAFFPYFWPDANTYYVDQLETGTYYYRTFAFNTDGISSPRGAQWSVVIA